MPAFENFMHGWRKMKGGFAIRDDGKVMWMEIGEETFVTFFAFLLIFVFQKNVVLKNAKNEFWCTNILSP